MITKTVFKTRVEWLEYRGKDFKIGGSDIGTILGLDPFKTPYQFWYDYKNHLQVNPEQSQLYRGLFMEDGVAKWFEQESGEKVIKRSDEISVFHNSKYPDYFQVAPDRELFKNGRKTRPLLECKDTRLNILSLEDIKTESPQWYAQGQYQLGLMERDEFFLAINTGNKELLYTRFSFDQEYFNNIITYVSEWVNKYIFGDEMPPLTTVNDMAIAYPVSESKEIVIGTSLKEQIVELWKKKQAIKSLQKEEEVLKNKIVVEFKECDTMIYEGLPIATYKTNKNGNRILQIKIN